MKKVLVTGASGFIGRYSLPLLVARGFDVYAVSSQPKESGPITWLQADLLNASDTIRCLERASPSHLLHLAWNATPGKFWTARDNLDWLQSSITLLEAFVLQGGKRVVMAGTCAEYDWNAEEFSEFQTPCRPQTLYGSCKLALHLLLESLARQMGFSQAWGRLFYLYGPHEYPQRFIPAVIQGLLKKERVPCSHGNQVRDFLHVEDVASAFVALLESRVEGVVNIGSGEGVALKEAIEALTQILGGGELIQLGALSAPANDPPRLIADTTRLKRELDWSPKYTLKQGLRETVAWWEEFEKQRKVPS